MKTSLIATVLNEEENILLFLESLLIQSGMQDEVVIVDGGSEDRTVTIIKNFIQKHSLPYKLLLSTKEGNRSVGRNEAIRKTHGEIILISDPGCVLDKNWIKEMMIPITDKKADVVAGYYSARSENIFQKCLVPYVLVMPDKVNEKDFLPATRSMAIKKIIWEEMGGFDERYSHNEDYVFAKKLKKEKKKIIFTRKAIVYWIPRRNLLEAFLMFQRFAYGDMEASILRPKVVLIIFRYLAALLFIIFAITKHTILWWLVLLAGIILYSIWSIYKNYSYIKDARAIYYLPLIQFTSDIAVLLGSCSGFLASRRVKKL